MKAIECTTCGEDVAKKAFLCPYCGVLLRPNYFAILCLCGVWLASVWIWLMGLMIPRMP